jgi:hypothetical protein
MPLFCGRKPTMPAAGALPFSIELGRFSELILVVAEVADGRVRLLVDDSVTVDY